MADITHSITFIYANVSYICRRAFWDSIYQVYLNMIHPWAIISDFNAMIGAHEKIGPPHQTISFQEFKNGINSCILIDINTSDAFYTWSCRHGNSLLNISLIELFARLTAWMIGIWFFAPIIILFFL